MVIGNLAQGGAGGSGANGGDGLGGGIMAGLVGQASTVSLTVSGSAVAANVAAGGSGGANANGGNGDGGGLDLASGTDCLQYSRIVGNLAVGGIAGSGGTPGEGIGGGLYIASLAVADGWIRSSLPTWRRRAMTIYSGPSVPRAEAERGEGESPIL